MKTKLKNIYGHDFFIFQGGQTSLGRTPLGKNWKPKGLEIPTGQLTGDVYIYSTQISDLWYNQIEQGKIRENHYNILPRLFQTKNQIFTGSWSLLLTKEYYRVVASN